MNRTDQEHKLRRQSLRRASKLSKSLHREAMEVAREEAREEAEGIRAMLRAELEGTNLRNSSGHIDHTPGGSPSPYPPAAPAPDRTYHPAKTLRNLNAKTPDGRVTFPDLLARANRAARQAMRDKAWSAEDRQDAASYAVESVIRRATETEGKRPDVAADLCSGVALYRLARDCRESKVASRDRDQAEGIAASFRDIPDQADNPGELAPDVSRFPIHALRFAWDACDALGVASTGETFTIAYTVARMVSGVGSLGRTRPDSRELELTQADVARELGLAPGAHRNILYRARAKYPAASKDYRAPKRYRTRGNDTVSAFLDALHILNNPRAGSSRVGSAGLPEQWRGYDSRSPAPMGVKVKRCKVYCRRTPAAWTLGLSPRQRHALHAASIARQSKVGIPEDRRVKLAA